MNGLISRTRLVGLASLAALAAMVLPSVAQAGKSHLVKQYKVERQLDVEGQDGTETLTCPGSDLALDGMWRVDNVEPDADYENAGPGGSWSTLNSDPLDHSDWDLLRSLRPVQAARAGDSSYDFKFTPLSGGDVSMKLWITCLGDKSQPVGSHTVNWQITEPVGGSTSEPITDTTAGGTFTTPVAAASRGCPAGFVVVQPSFTVTSGDADLVASYPSAKATRWTWTFANRSTPFNASVSWKCLELKSQAASSGPAHRHRLVRNMSKVYSPSDGKFKKNGHSEVQRNCGEHYKGMVGGWDYSGFAGFRELYFLGMDPRIKTRAFRFLNGDTANDQAADLSLVCFKDKTT